MSNRGINKVILIGNLGQDPEIRHLQNGKTITNITLATSEKWKDKNSGEIKEKIEWHRVVFFGKIAEIAGEYLKKGSKVYIEGSLQTRKWKDNKGQNRYITEIIVNINGSMLMLKNSNNNLNINKKKWKNSNNLNKSNILDINENNELYNNKNELDFNDENDDDDDEIPF